MIPYTAEADSFPISIFVAGDAEEAASICRDYCEAFSYCVTVTPTRYLYKGGDSAGVIVGLINYPRFPESRSMIWDRAEALAFKLIEGLGQESCTIQAPTRSYFISFREQVTL